MQSGFFIYMLSRVTFYAKMAAQTPWKVLQINYSDLSLCSAFPESCKATNFDFFLGNPFWRQANSSFVRVPTPTPQFPGQCKVQPRPWISKKGETFLSAYWFTLRSAPPHAGPCLVGRLGGREQSRLRAEDPVSPSLWVAPPTLCHTLSRSVQESGALWLKWNFYSV